MSMVLNLVVVLLPLEVLLVMKYWWIGFSQIISPSELLFSCGSAAAAAFAPHYYFLRT
jgi:hypothetical protein